MKIFSIYTSKGGIGKSSLAEGIASWLVALGRNVCLVDTDRQANTSNLVNMEAVPANSRKTLTHVVRDGVPLFDAMYQARRNLWVIPSDTNINKASNYIVVEQEPELLVDCIDDLKAALTPSQFPPLAWHGKPEVNIRQFKAPAQITPDEVLIRPNSLDYFIVDHAPNPGAVGESFLRATEEIWSPLVLEPYPVQGFAHMILTVNDLFKRASRKPKVHIVPFKVDHQREMTTTYLADLYMLYPTETGRSVHEDPNIPKAQGEDPPQTIVEFSRSCRASKEMLELALQMEGYSGTLQNGHICDACLQIREFAEEELAARKVQP